MIQVNFKVPEKTKELLQKEAHHRGISLSEYIRSIVIREVSDE